MMLVVQSTDAGDVNYVLKQIMYFHQSTSTKIRVSQDILSADISHLGLLLYSAAWF